MNAPSEKTRHSLPTSGVIVQSNRALAYDRRHANRRAVFALTHELAWEGGTRWRLSRQWWGIDDEPLSHEEAHWDAHDGLAQTTATSPSMGETLLAQRIPGVDEARVTYQTRRTSGPQASPIERRLEVPQRAFTLASAPLEIAASWDALLAGKRFLRRFLVLKVQRHAAVEFEAVSISERHVVVALTPVAWPLRWLFGRTLFHFDRTSISLTAIDGLLDPRDRRRNGRWYEYLGRIEFATSVALGRVVAAAHGPGAAR